MEDMASDFRRQSGNKDMTVFWYIAPCSPVEIDRRFRGACCLHHQGSRTSEEPLKRRSISTRLHGAVYQKKVIFILAAVRIFNLKKQEAGTNKRMEKL
jgi:hypothetical protein